MKKGFTGKLKILLLVALALSLGLTILSVIVPTGQGGLVQTVLSPFRAGVSTLVRQAERYYDYVFRYEALLAENEALQKKVVQMEDEVRTADSLQRENERLRQLLSLSEEHEDYYLASAYIVSWDTSNWKSTFTLDKGTKSGIDTGMVAITEYGQVVGLITDAGANWATVTTILDSSMQISASVASTGYTGIAEGSYATGVQGKLRLDYLPTDAVLRNDDQVVTTGSTVYPRGLIIGYICGADFDETGVAKYALLTPAADLDNLEQVFIVTAYENQ